MRCKSSTTIHTDAIMADQNEFDTLALRTGIHRSQFGEHSEAMYLTSSFVFENAAQAAARFTGGAEGNIYSRFTNPTVSAFQERLAALEGAEACVATASGMSAILATAMAALKAGDHVLCSASVFGSTVQLFSNIMGKFGVETTFVAAATRRRPGDPFGDQVSGRPGQGARRSGAGAARAGDGRRLRFPAHCRSESVPVQCMGVAEGPGNAKDPHGRPV